MYDNGMNPKKMDAEDAGGSQQVRQELLGVVIYPTNFLLGS